jgi:hypothetical protein
MKDKPTLEELIKQTQQKKAEMSRPLGSWSEPIPPPKKPLCQCLYTVGEWLFVIAFLIVVLVCLCTLVYTVVGATWKYLTG